MTQVQGPPRRSLAARATVVLPAPTGPTSTAPPWSRTAASSRSDAGPGGAVLQSTGTRRILCDLGVFSGAQRSSRAEIATLVYVVDVSTDPGREWAVCVYCASGPRHPELLELARSVGGAVAGRGWTLVSGGGNVSAMGALATGARARGGRTVGVIPKALVHRELADVDADELVVTESMRERKQVMEDRADAFIALPGGIGTLEEFFEAWTAGYLGMHDKPVVMLDPFGHYDGLRAWLYGLIDSGYVSQTALDRLDCGGRHRRCAGGLCTGPVMAITRMVRVSVRRHAEGNRRMTDEKSGTRSSVGLLDIASRVPGLLMDAPTILRGVITGFGARPSAKTSIGKVFQDRAAHYADKVFLKFDDQEITYREANETVNRYAAVLAARGVGHGDVVGIMLRNSPEPVLLMLAAVKCGAISGMLNYHQRGDVLKHSLGLLSATVVVADPDFVDPINESGADTDGLVTLDEFKRLAETAPTSNPATAAAVLAKDKAFYIFTSGTTGMPKASVMTHYRWLRALAGFGGLGMRLNSNDTLYCCLPLYHNNALTVALSAVLNSGVDAGARQVVLGVEVLGRRDPLRRHRVRLHRRDLRLPAQPAREGHRSQAQGAGDRGQRAAPGDLGRVHRAVRHRPGVRVLRAPARATPRSSTCSTSTRPPASARRRWRSSSTTTRPVTRSAATTAASARSRPASRVCCCRRSAASSRSTATPTRRPARRSWCATPSRRATSGSTPAT